MSHDGLREMGSQRAVASYGASLLIPSGLERWCGISTLQDKHHNTVSILNAYSTCQSHINTVPLGSTYARKYDIYQRCGHKLPNSRKSFVDEIGAAINPIIQSLDSTLASDTCLQAMLDSCDLKDLHEHNGAQSTYNGSENQRIGCMFGSPSTIIDAVTRSGILSYIIEGPQTDHHAL